MEIGLVWLSLLVGSAGVGIILFTVCVRAVLAPLQITQLRNAKAMQRLQPPMSELKKQHDISLDRRDVELAEPIKRLGDYQVPIKIGHGLEPKLKVTLLGPSRDWTAPQLIETGEAGKPVLLLMRDSFSTALLPFL